MVKQTSFTMRTVKVLPKCQGKINKQILWYKNNAGMSYARTMINNLQRDLFTLASMPTIGKKLKVSNGQQFYVMPSKKKAEIIYRFDDETLYITDVIFYYSKK